ncbi:helix-turn-helix domain-containing protein, partial [Streptomyces anulatus]|uniref:helix-turn-helix domain-containing protein n=1 Tax=Streptomyces anulatus TaxID=1892 RepID=UPI003F4D5B2A
MAKICAALNCTVADLMEAEPVDLEKPQRAVGGDAGVVGAPGRPGGGPGGGGPRRGGGGGGRRGG